MLTIDDLKQKTKEKRLTYEQLSVLANVPIGTLKHLFSGRIPNPGYDTVCAIMRALGLDNDAPVPDVLKVYNALSAHSQVIAMAYMEGLLNAEGKEISDVIFTKIGSSV